jgi:hypothetical protein
MGKQFDGLLFKCYSFAPCISARKETAMSMKKSVRWASVLLIILLVTIGLSATSAQAALSTSVACILPNGCIQRESGSNAQWWADSWYKGTCRGHTGQDWIVTYKVNNTQWRNADQSKVRFYAASWSLARYWKWAGQMQVENNSLSSGGGIKICLSGVLGSNDVKGTYLWLKP